MAISFFQEDTDLRIQPKTKYKSWLKKIASEEGYIIKDLNYIFCSDEYLHQINVEYLNHDDYTDIITFDNSEKEKSIEGDVFVSWDRVQENAILHNTPKNIELLRVMSHGLLHLMGYKDKKEKEKETMKQMEDASIKLFDTV
jgi:probable rRNA maturation factor